MARQAKCLHRWVSGRKIREEDIARECGEGRASAWKIIERNRNDPGDHMQRHLCQGNTRDKKSKSIQFNVKNSSTGYRIEEIEERLREFFSRAINTGAQV